MENPEHIASFVTAGRAVFTIESRKTGARYTYRVNEIEDKPGSFFASLLTGPDNTSDYSYIGLMNVVTGFRTTKNSKMTETSTPVRALKFFCEKVVIGKREPYDLDMNFWHEGRCGKCSRPLTVPSSIVRGIGPECATKMGLD